MNQEQSAAALEDFINDFGLRKSEGIVSFSAVIRLFFNGRLHIFESEMQVILNNHLHTLYIIAAPGGESLPDVFDLKQYYYLYQKGNHLRVTPVSENGKTYLSVFPK